MRIKDVVLQPVMRSSLLLFAGAVFVFSGATLAQADSKAEKEVKDHAEKSADEVDPCAEDNKNYPWGMSPCKEFQIKKKWNPDPAIPGQGVNKNVPILKK